MERLVPFGKYFLLERINVGGMAEVFKAKTVGVEGFEKIVAIKRILPAVAEDEDFIKMFVDEAKITSQLSHANLAQTFDLGRIDDTYYIAMEYVPGKDVRSIFERMKRRAERMPLHVAAYVIARVCDGLDYAHRKRGADGKALGIVHRDVSPQNVILSFEGEVKLVDFGIAKAANKITKTEAGILKGKFGYMSPEQVRGLPLDGRSDIFAAGVVLYELVTGERLFTGSSDFSVLEKVQAAKIVPPSHVAKDVPPGLERVILKALARETEDRYQHAADLGSDLTRFLMEWRGKSVTREDVAAFMKSTFPQDNAKDVQLPLDSTRTGARKDKKPPTLPPPAPSAQRAEGGIERPRVEAEVVARSEPERAPSAAAAAAVAGGAQIAPSRAAPAPSATPAFLADTTDPSAQTPATPAASAPEEEPTRPMSMDDLAAAERAYLARTRGDEVTPAKLSEERRAKAAAAPPAGPPPLPPAKARPDAKARHSRPPPPLPASLLADDPVEAADANPATPGAIARPADPAYDATDPNIALEAGRARPGAGPPGATRRRDLPFDEGEAAKVSPPVSLSRPPPASAGLPPRPEVSGVRSEGRPSSPSGQYRALAGPHNRPPTPSGQHRALTPEGQQDPVAVRAAPQVSDAVPEPAHDRPPFGGRIATLRPTLLAEDATGDREITDASLFIRARWLRRALYGVIAVALAVTGWALYTAAQRSKKPAESAVPTGSLLVTTEPEDAVVLLDGAQVKDPLDRDFTEPRLSAKAEHKLVVRREGFEEQAITVVLQAKEQKTLEVKLAPLPGQLTIRSDPAGAQVFVDGTRRGVTPVHLADVDQSQAHAIVLEKRCFHTWQLAIQARGGKREVAASLQALPGACAGLRYKTEQEPTPQVPDDPKLLASLGYLTLSARPATAHVFIDGVDIGRTTPLAAWPLKVGKHKIRISTGKKSRDLAVEIRSGQTHSEIVDLRRR